MPSLRGAKRRSNPAKGASAPIKISRPRRVGWIAASAFGLLAITITPPAHAASSALSSFNTLADAIRSNDAITAKTYIIPSGMDLFNRFTGYGLLPCVPQNATFSGEKASGKWMLVKSSLEFQGKPRQARLYFAQDNGVWKLDINETLRRGLGQNWQKQVNVMEQLYRLLAMQMGDKLDCKAVQALATAE